jgi:predicted enzyme related to lactoylglutathione lyase
LTAAAGAAILVPSSVKGIIMSHPVVHFEIGCQDKEKTSQFYRRVFGWAIDSGPMGLIDTGSGAGIPGHIASLGHEPHQFTHFYIETDDVPGSLEKVEAAGGKIIVPPVQIPAGTFAWFADVEGNTVGLWKPTPGA